MVFLLLQVQIHKTKDLLWLMKTMILFVSSTDNVSVLKFTRIFNLVLQKEKYTSSRRLLIFSSFSKVCNTRSAQPKTFWVSLSTQSLFLNEVYISWQVETSLLFLELLKYMNVISNSSKLNVLTYFHCAFMKESNLLRTNSNL